MVYKDDGYQTELSAHRPSVAEPEAQLFTIEALQGPAAGKTLTCTDGRCAVGSHPSNNLVIEDPTVSRFHAELVVDEGTIRVRDLGSLNGISIDGVVVYDGLGKDGSLLRLGDTVLRLRLAGERARIPVDPEDHFGVLTGSSVAMRAAFHLLRRASQSDATVLLEGETGTGKDAAAESVHAASPRSQGPFVIIDCGSIPSNLIESELFGHEKGAFTGATATRVGAFEAASGGTVFLDEVGELPLDLQPRLLRVLEQRTVRRVGATARIPIDVRLIAATNRDLRQAVNAGTFREDLYYRLAVVRVRMPALRERPDDIPMIAESILRALQADPETVRALLTPERIGRMQRGAWSGNVRELRNFLEQSLVMLEPPPLTVDESEALLGPQGFEATPAYEVARRRAVDDFERRYVRWLLGKYGENVSHAARVAGMNRRYLYRLRDRHGV